MVEVTKYEAFDGTLFDTEERCLKYEKFCDNEDGVVSEDREYEPHRAIGSTFEFEGHTLIVRESEGDFAGDCLHRCFFGRDKSGGGKCLKYFDVHGCCCASDIGRLNSLYFEEVQKD